MTTKEVYELLVEELEDVLWGKLSFTGQLIMWEFGGDSWDENFEDTMDSAQYDDMERIKSFLEDNNIEHTILDFEREHDYMSCYIDTE